jgi:uncharacterized protein (DUF2267 family)
MDAADLYDRVAARLADEDVDVRAETLTHAVLTSLAERLTPEEAAELGAEMPDELGDLLASASGDGHLARDEFLEDVAARLDLDDRAAEAGTLAVLAGLRELLEPMVAMEQILESLPPDLAQMMHA